MALRPLRAHWGYTLAPLLLCVIALTFWRSSFTDAVTMLPTIDVAGRYALPLETSFVLLIACFFAHLSGLLRLAVRSRWGTTLQRVAVERMAVGRATVESYRVGHFVVERFAIRSFSGRRPSASALSSYAATALLILLVALYAIPYTDSNMVNALQTPYRGADVFHTEQSAIIAYMRQQHIRYIWTVHWIGNVLMYLEDEHVTCVDYVALTVGHDRERFPEASAAISRADRPSFLIEADAMNGEPAVLRALDGLGVNYTWRIFGNLWMVTPISRTVHPAEIVQALVMDY